MHMAIITMQILRGCILQYNFDNGLTLSMGIGDSHYHTGRTLGQTDYYEKKAHEYETTITRNMEVAVLFDTPDGHVFTTQKVLPFLFSEDDKDDVAGWVEVDTLAQLLEACDSFDTSTLEA